MEIDKTPSSAGPTKLGLDPNLEAALAYLFFCLSGILFFLLETENKRVRFHAFQSFLLFTGLTVLNFCSIVFMIFTQISVFQVLISLIGLASFVLWLVLVIRTYQGHDLKLPVVGDIAQKQVGWP